MKKLDYQEQKSQIEDSIKALTEEKTRLTNRYIELNKKFDVGQKVVVTDANETEHIGFVSKIFVGYKADVEYKFFKCKKDGTPSKHELWLWKITDVKAFS